MACVMAGRGLAVPPAIIDAARPSGSRGTCREERRVHDRPVEGQGLAGESLVSHAMFDAQPDARRLLCPRGGEAPHAVQHLRGGGPAACQGRVEEVRPNQRSPVNGEQMGYCQVEADGRS